MPTPTPAVQPAPVVRAPPQGPAIWPWLAVGAGLLLAMGGWAWWRRRPANATARPGEDEVLPLPSVSRPIATPVPPSEERAAIAVALRPIRAGLNLLSATVEAEVVVTNTGDAPATHVRVHVSLLSAHARQDVDLTAAFAAPAGRPVTPPFTLAAGEERRVRIVAALPRESVRTMEAGGRPMFVPLLAIDVRYAAETAGRLARTAQAFIVGVERADSAKLAPFWIDGPSRMYDRIAARTHGAVIES
ncbi:hypothetical protein [Sphingomonas bacterium]|nr:hypothetical protein [Sphingomonas bacterium]